MEPCLYIVATPIGNLDDMTIRATKTLTDVDVIAAEDTRRAKQLLNHLGVPKKEVISYFDHVEQAKAPLLIERLEKEGISMALISDAGTPCVSDPGYRLVAEAHRVGIKVVPIPGASALTSLVSGSGLPSDRFLFVGFLPSKDAALKSEVESWTGSSASVIFYESTRRLKKALNVISRVHPDAQVAVGRELTKMHEELRLMPLEESLEWCENHETLRGEVALMLSGFSGHAVDLSQQDMKLEEKLKAALASGKRFKEVLKEYKDCGLSRQELYQLLVSLKEKSNES